LTKFGLIDIDAEKFETHPQLHQISQAHHLQCQVNQNVYDLIVWATQCPEIPWNSQAYVIREALYQALVALKDQVDEGVVPRRLRDQVRQDEITNRYMRLREERERMQHFLRVARDELVQLIKQGDTARARTYVEETLEEYAALGDGKRAKIFLGLPVVSYILDGGKEDMDAFTSERGIP